MKSQAGPRLVALSSLLLLATSSVAGQTRHAGRVVASCVAAEQMQGVIVETVAKNSEGEKADLAGGDVILTWALGDARGDLQSPFDLGEVETEQEPRGQVTLAGTRGGLNHLWVLGPDDWGIQVRPNLPSNLLAGYLEAQESAKAGRLDQMAEQLRTAATEGQKDRCSFLAPWLLFHAAQAFAGGQEWRDSTALYQSAVRAAVDARPEVRAQLLQALAHAFAQQSDWANSEKYQQEALQDIRKSGPQKLAAATSLIGLGMVADNRGDLDKAQEDFSEALAVSEKLAPGSLVTATILLNLGGVADERGDLDKADEYEHRSLAISQRLVPGRLPVAASLNSLGNVADDRGDLNGAEDFYRQALDIRQKLAPGSLDELRSLIALGNIADDRGDLSKAEDFYRQALVIGKKIAPGSLRVAACLNNLGLVANERGDLVGTEAYYRQALDIRQKLARGSLDVAASFNNLGNVEDDRGDTAKAEDYYNRALEIEKKLAPESMVVPTALYNLGEDARRSGNSDQAENYFHQALQKFEKTAPGGLQVGMVLASLGQVSVGRGDFAKAEQLFRQTLAIDQKLAPDSLDVATTLNSLGAVARDRGELAKGEDYYRQSLEIRRKLAPETAAYAESLATLAGIARDNQRVDEAMRLYAQAIDVLESQVSRMGGSSDVRTDFRAQHAEYYSAYSNLLVTQSRPELAFQTMERSRARTLLEALAEAHVDIRQGANPSLLEQERMLQATMAAKSIRKINLLQGPHTDEQAAAVDKEIIYLLNQYQEVEGQIRSNNPKYAALTQPQPLSAKEIQDQLLDANTMLLEYAMGEKRSLVFALTPTSLDAFELPGRFEIQRAAHALYDVLLTPRTGPIEGETSLQRQQRISKGETELQAKAARLSQMILGPVSGLLGKKRLLIVADGALQYVPFAVLSVPAGDASEAAVPLVATHEIVNLPSASVLSLLRRQGEDRETPPKEVAVLADPVFERGDPRVGKAANKKQPTDSALEEQSLSSIPQQLAHSRRDVGSRLQRLGYTRQEADAIMAMSDPGEGMEAVDFEASRETALSKDLSEYRIVHFATHGMLDNEHPELSGLVLSLVNQNGKAVNGFLDLEDVYNLTLPADLVVLSACETGLGKEVTGEGLIGLTRGFMYAGASRVVASLWKVDDVATADLMRRFYRGMLKEGMPPAAALRQAQMEVRQQKRWADPHYWAAFTIQGEWR